MSALKRITLFLIGAALVATLWIGGRSLKATGPQTSRPTRSTSQPAGTPTVAPSIGPASRAGGKGPDVRVIARGSIATPEIKGPLERIAPREPSAAATKPLKREVLGPPVPSGTLLYQPVAKTAGEIEANGYTVRLAGIEPTPADRTCTYGGGPSWPCGVVARTAFRAWMRGRAAACDVPSTPREITTHCTLDGEDMALWLVENGWAESTDSQYDDAEAKARQEKKGLYGPSPLEAK